MLILIVIVFNSVTMAAYDYSDRDSNTFRNQIIDLCGQISTFFFVSEGALEIIARGFIVDKRAYLRDGWCVLDFIVLISG